MTRTAHKAAAPRAAASTPLFDAIRAAAPDIPTDLLSRVAEVAQTALAGQAANAGMRGPSADDVRYFSSRRGLAHLLESCVDERDKIIDNVTWLLCSIDEAAGERAKHVSALCSIGLEWMYRASANAREFTPWVDAALANARVEGGQS